MTENPSRVVIVTGGSRGLGAGIVQSYLDTGDIVATCARSGTGQIDKWLADPATRDRLLFREVDLSDRAATAAFVKEVFDHWGQIDVLVNNAGVARDGVLGLASDDDIDAVIDLNLKGTLQITKLVSRRMLARGSGSIVNISSIVGLSGYRGLSVYSATKAAMDGLTRALARELGSRGIIVNSVAPGYLRTEMSHGLDEAQLGQIVRRTPAGRLGEPADVARLVQFLTAPENDYLTGQVIVIDGGLTA
ncbi:MAG: 3-oxoacyl-[acyl-carrier protein] reductase [Pseudonocardiales bacterium]|jgi:3-oxoacyl-[acyl-carrier protein] reductase|nr:3-oxoacyl-ACP reductase [Pseudonocardiales bacterium]MDT4909952.1 3-oxoacyl-[acyl-carrier protein] reductase [Pseudonocardiales bacterium]MDT4958036.1 3-oxoacyl-[acyl-carrier protein] reductase [Pseudonocardiales bacterium]MDT4961575.1 3-oxoacyl-[acyl-carrier protein] reductase [Pseudonocardiales bacterium]MDT4971584.1 3-oxoacyl-[acyl-carrier protein] reductase [Pseudonocardiales bacterium]